MASKLGQRLASLHALGARSGLREGVVSLKVNVDKSQASSGLRAFVASSLPALKLANPEVRFTVHDAKEPGIVFGWAEGSTPVEVDGYDATADTEGILAASGLRDEELFDKVLAVAGAGATQ